MSARAATTKRPSQVYLRFMSNRVVMGEVCSTRSEPPNARTDRCGRPVASELETDTARPHSVQ